MESAPLSVLLVDADPVSLNYLSGLLVKQEYNVQAASSAKVGYITALRDHPDVIVFDPSFKDMSAVEFVHKLRNDRRTATTLLVALAATDNAQMGELMTAGCNEFMLKSQESIGKLQTLLASMSGQVQETRPMPGVQKRKQGGLLVVFLSAKGGTGTSSLCANIAQNISANQPQLDIAVMDLVLPIGSIASTVGYQGDFTLVQAVAHDLETLNGDFLRRTLTPQPNWSFRLLAGAPDPEAANSLDASRIPVLTQTFKQAFDLTLVDLGRSLSRISLPIILDADAVALIVSSDLSTVTMTHVVWEYLNTQGLDTQRISAIMNRAVGLEGLSKSDAERIIGLPIETTIPYMTGNFTLANNQHLPLLTKFPNDTAALVLDQVSRQILDVARRARI